MASSALQWQSETVQVGENALVVLKAGQGPPLVIFHEELGCPATTAWQERMAETRTLLVPQHPGFGRSDPAEWMTSVRDLAGFYARYLRQQGLAPADAIGFSLGGWIAAEMAASDPAIFSHMVLVSPMGAKPPEGHILDMFLLTAEKYLRDSVLDPAATPEFTELYGAEITPEQFEAFDEARAQAARLAWQPYMFNPSLPYLLGSAEKLSTLLLWGERDIVVPVSAAEIYRKALPAAKLVTFPECGHRPEIEKREEFLSELQAFLD